MKFSWIIRSLQASAIASAMLLVLPAGAQTPAPDTPATTAAPAGPATSATPRLHNRPHRAPRHHQRTSNGEPANASALATDLGATAADYQRNAMSRCDVFKMQEERKACMDRMRQAPQGSVQDGGVLREHTYEVPANGS